MPISAWCEVYTTAPTKETSRLVAETYMDKRDPSTQVKNSSDHIMGYRRIETACNRPYGKFASRGTSHNNH